MSQEHNGSKGIFFSVSASGKMAVGEQIGNNANALLIKESRFQSINDAWELRLYAVTDGMGSSVKLAELASILVLQTLEQQTQAFTISRGYSVLDILREVVIDAHDKIHEYVQGDLRSEEQYMGSTLVAAMIHDKILYVANVGDCRAYLIRNEDIEQITTDHTQLQRLIEIGQLSAEEAARHRDRSKYVYRYLGSEDLTEIDVFNVPLNPSDKILLCSSGLIDVVGNQEILDIIEAAKTGENACEELLECASDNAADCAAIILITIGGDG